jgi:hypothetical protein
MTRNEIGQQSAPYYYNLLADGQVEGERHRSPLRFAPGRTRQLSSVVDQSFQLQIFKTFCSPSVLLCEVCRGLVQQIINVKVRMNRMNHKQAIFERLCKTL